MTKIDTIRLIWEEIGKDEDGFPKTIRHDVECFASEKSVTRAETYESMRAGVSVKTVFSLRQEAWESTRHIVDGKPEYARKVECDGCIYYIVRAFKKGKSKVEVSCA